MVADEALGRKRCAHRVSRSVRTSKTRMGLTRARLLWWVEFEAEKRDGHMIEVAVAFSLAGYRTITLLVDRDAVVRKTGGGLFEYGWVRHGHAYLVKEAAKARSDAYDVFELGIDDQTYRDGGAADRAAAEAKDGGGGGTDTDDSDHGRRAGRGADAKPPRHFAFNTSPKKDRPQAKDDAPAPARAPPKASPPGRLWRMNRPGEHPGIENRGELRRRSSSASKDGDGDEYETRTAAIAGTYGDGDSDENATFDIDAFRRCISSPTRREGGGFYSLLCEVRTATSVV